MLKRSYERKSLFVLAVWAFMMRTLSLGHNAYKFINAAEMVFPILLILVASFVLYDKNEIELALVNGTKTTKLFFTHLVPFITYTMLPSVIFALIFKSHTDGEFDPSSVTMMSIPEYIPDNYKLLMTVSLVITIVFFYALYSLIRVITRNCFIPMFLGFGLVTVFTGFSAAVQAMKIPMTCSFFDPLINSYFIGDTIPNAYAEKYPELVGMAQIWTYNRLFFVFLSALLFFITYLILRREKLHCGIGE